MAAYESTAGGGGFEMKWEKSLDAKNFFPDQSTGGGSGTKIEMKREKGLVPKSFILDLIAGGSAAVCAKGFMLPVETMLGLQKKNGSLDNFKSQKWRIAWGKQIPGLIARFAPMQALTFAFKEDIRAVELDEGIVGPYLHNFIAGAFGGGIALGLVYPLDLARARLGTDAGRAGYMDKGLWDCLIKTAKTEGRRGLYKGFLAQNAPVFMFYEMFFGIFDSAKTLYTSDGKKFDYVARVPAALMAWFGAITISNALWRVMEMRVKERKLTGAFTKGSLSGAYRSGGGISAVFFLILLEAFNDRLPQKSSRQ